MEGGAESPDFDPMQAKREDNILLINREIRQDEAVHELKSQLPNAKTKEFITGRNQKGKVTVALIRSNQARYTLLEEKGNLNPSGEGLTLETSVLESFTVAYLPYRPCG